MKIWLPSLFSMLCASAAFADPPVAPEAGTQRAEALVQRQLLQPLKDAESQRKRFSRAARPPQARRVRVLDGSLQTDASGKRFVRFAVDARYAAKDESRWEREVYTGCAYPDEDQVFVRLGTDYVRASTLLQGGDQTVQNACRAATSRATSTSRTS